MFSFARSTIEIERRAVSIIFEENPDQDLLSRYISDTMDSHSKALTASNKDMEVAYFYYVKYLHMCGQLRTLIYSGNTLANTKEHLDDILEVTEISAHAHRNAEKIKKTLDAEFVRGKEIARESKGVLERRERGRSSQRGEIVGIVVSGDEEGPESDVVDKWPPPPPHI